MDRPLPEAREVGVVRGLFTVDDTARAADFVSGTIPDRIWEVQIRTAKVQGQIMRRIRFRIVSQSDPTLTATGVVRPWD